MVERADLVVAVLLSQLVAKVGDVNSRACGFQFIERGFYFADNAVVEGAAILPDTLLFEFGVGDLGTDAATGEKRKVDREDIGIGGNTIVESIALIRPETSEADLREALFLRGVGGEFGDTRLGNEGTNFRALGESEIEQSIFIELGKIEEVEMIDDLEILIARKVEELGKIVLGGVSLRFGVDASMRFWRSFWSSTWARTVSMLSPRPVF